MTDFKITHISETDSTNRWLKDSNLTGGQAPCEVVVADYQTAGRGCGSNMWESERGKNLLFSVLIHPTDIGPEAVAQQKRLPASRQFHISMAISLAICEALGQYIGDLGIKWPNDIYWRNGKIAGILIENTLHGSFIRDSIIGVGVNVNQREFHSDAPNPVSLWQVCEHETDRDQLLHDILQAFKRFLAQDCREQYRAQLYRRQGYHPYADKNGAFMAELVTVEDDGRLRLCDDNGKERSYAFKEVQFII